MSLIIREAHPDEYAEVARITVAAYEEYAANLTPDDWTRYREDLSDVASRAALGPVLVAETTGRLVAAVSYYPLTVGERPSTPWWPEDYAYVRALAVSPQARGQGVGRAVTQACIERARTDGANGIGLNTTSLMPVARAMYERMGFHKVPEPPTSTSGIFVFSYLLDFKDVP